MKGFHVVILSGSKSDEPLVKEVKDELRSYGVRDIDEELDSLNNGTKDFAGPTFEWRITSAHRNRTSEVYKDYQDKNKVIFIDRVTLSDALSGNAASQGFGHPVIACPGFPSDVSFTAYPASTVDCPPLVAPMFAYTPHSAALNAALIAHMGGPCATKPTILARSKADSDKVSSLLGEYGFVDRPADAPSGGSLILAYDPDGTLMEEEGKSFKSWPSPVIVCRNGIPVKSTEDMKQDTFLYVHKRPENLALAAAMIQGAYDEVVWKKVVGKLGKKADSVVSDDKAVRSRYR